MLISTSKFLALLALVASVAAAPQASSSVATTSGGQSSSSATKAATANVRSSATTTTTPPLFTNTRTDGIVTEVTIGTLVKSSVSGSQVLVTSSIAETVTLYRQSVSIPSPMPYTHSTTPAVTTSSQAATATPTTARTNGSPARIGGGMGLAAIVSIVGVVAAVL